MARTMRRVITALLFSPSKALLKASFTSSGMEKFMLAMVSASMSKISTIKMGAMPDSCKRGSPALEVALPRE
jgi:hypothetical protein